MQLFSPPVKLYYYYYYYYLYMPSGVKCPRVRNIKYKSSGVDILLGWYRE